jgi:hypothetical protein
MFVCVCGGDKAHPHPDSSADSSSYSEKTTLYWSPSSSMVNGSFANIRLLAHMVQF